MVDEYGWHMTTFARKTWTPYAKARFSWGQRYSYGVLAIGPRALAWRWVGRLVQE